MNIYDAIVIGAGPAGLTAGIYLSRAGISTLILEKITPGGQAALTETIENYPGFPESIGGFELIKKMEEQTKKFGAIIENEEVVKIDVSKNLKCKSFEVLTNKDKYNSLSIIISTGSQPKKLNIKGEEEFIGRGVSYCATCDAPFFKDKEVIVIGGGNSAIDEALFLTKFASKVNLIHRRDRLRATKILQERAYANKKINFILNSIITEIKGQEDVHSVRIKNLRTEKEEDMQTSGVFVFTGFLPNTKFLQGLVNLDEEGYIITDENMKTSECGIFACGDVRKKILRQVVTACSDGAIAAFSCQNYIEELKGIPYL